jgi:hypothetical protein
MKKQNTKEYVKTLEKQDLLYLGKSLFVIDPEIEKIHVSDIVLHIDTEDYIFKNENFIKIYLQKLKDLAQVVLTNYFYLVIILVSIFPFAIYYFYIKRNKSFLF